MMISKIENVKKTVGVKGKLIQRSTYRQQYAGINSITHEPKIESVDMTSNIKKYHDNAGLYGNIIERVIDYKEEFRHYYALEQALEENLENPGEGMDFIDHLFLILSNINEVIVAVAVFDKAFDTSYSHHIGTIIDEFEADLLQATIMIHVDKTLGFFKGRMKKHYDLYPEHFDFLLTVNTGLIPMLISAFRVIKVIIPDKIEEMSGKQDQAGAVIDKKL